MTIAGEYRFSWVTPGRCLVQAGSGNITRGDLTPIESFGSAWPESGERGAGRLRKSIPMPGVLEIAQALAVDVRPRSELSAIDITLEPGQWFAVGGQVVDAGTGQSRLEGRIVIYEPASLHGIGGFPFEGDSYGLGRVRPGTYWLGSGPTMNRRRLRPGRGRRGGCRPRRGRDPGPSFHDQGAGGRGWRAGSGGA